MRDFRVTEVEATFTAEGQPLPHSMQWEGETLPVAERGRRWHTEDGLHMLVLVDDGRVFELHTNGAVWRAALVSSPQRFV
jgi:hypothetical protein